MNSLEREIVEEGGEKGGQKMEHRTKGTVATIEKS